MEVVTPSGFRDVLMDEASKRERVLRSVQDGFAARGYELIETPTLENAQVMQMGARMELSSFKFFDGGGTLVTMRPDVTLQVARICATRLKGQPGPFRFRYSQRIFRETGGISSAAERERTQVGVECIGESGPRADAEVIELFARSLEASGVSDFKISLATVSVLRAMLASSRAPQTWIDRVLEAFHLSDFVAIDQLTASADPSEVAPVFAQAIGKLASIHGGREAIDAVRALAEPLGCADGLDDLRYNKVIVATDADVDGMHIRLLMITFFLQFFPDLIKKGHVYILQTPLFRVRNKKKTVYCYSEDERVNAINELSPNPEITRFKGLGEISPDEFKHFIGKDMRLEQVTLRKTDAVKELLEFYMGKNTMERQNFIIDNLVIEEDLAS